MNSDKILELRDNARQNERVATSELTDIIRALHTVGNETLAYKLECILMSYEQALDDLREADHLLLNGMLAQSQENIGNIFVAALESIGDNKNV